MKIDHIRVDHIRENIKEIKADIRALRKRKRFDLYDDFIKSLDYEVSRDDYKHGYDDWAKEEINHLDSLLEDEIIKRKEALGRL